MAEIIDQELRVLYDRRDRLQDKIDNYDREAPPGYQASLDAVEALIERIEQRQEQQPPEVPSGPQQSELPFAWDLRYPTFR